MVRLAQCQRPGAGCERERPNRRSHVEAVEGGQAAADNESRSIVEAQALDVAVLPDASA